MSRETRKTQVFSTVLRKGFGMRHRQGGGRGGLSSCESEFLGHGNRHNTTTKRGGDLEKLIRYLIGGGSLEKIEPSELDGVRARKHAERKVHTKVLSKKWKILMTFRH